MQKWLVSELGKGKVQHVPKKSVSERRRKCSKNEGDMKKNKDNSLKDLPLVKSRTI